MYPDGQSFSSSLRIDLFAVLFWEPGIVLVHILKQLTQPARLASRNSGTGTVLNMDVEKEVPYERRRPTPFTHLAVSFIYVSSPLGPVNPFFKNVLVSFDSLHVASAERMQFQVRLRKLKELKD